MANKMARRFTAKQIAMSVAAFVLLIVAFTISFGEKMNIAFIPTWNAVYHAVGLGNEKAPFSNGATITFLDVGQGDCIVVHTVENAFMIDGGEAANSSKILEYLKSNGIKKLDYIFATHPQADHIGSLPYVLDEIAVDNVVISQIPQRLVPTTKTFTSFMDAVAKSGAKTKVASHSDEFEVCGGVLSVLAPINEGKSLNDCSLVMRFDYGNRSFLFTGDSEIAVEKELVEQSYSSLDVDVLKAAHHGSKTSSTDEFLDAVSPEYTVVSCGVGNIYGHPDAGFLQRMEERQIRCFRTDLKCTIIFKTDGEILNIDVEKDD